MYDDDFTKEFFNVLKEVYFKQYLPILMKH